MLGASAGFKEAMESSNRIFGAQVLVTRRGGGEDIVVDISDRVISYQLVTEYESRNARLGIELDNYDYALSPLNRDSSLNRVSGIYNPLFDSNHKIELFEGIKVGNEFEYRKKFEGYMGDDIQVSSSPTMNISCRDKSKLLQDIYIYEGPSYSLMLIEEVIQDLLNEFAPNLAITLNVLSATNYMIGRPDGPYTPKDTNLWDAIQMLADSAGLELRFLEDARLIIRRIDRDFEDNTPKLFLDQSSLISDDMSISDADVRNHIVVKVQGFDPITKKGTASIAKYGTRYMEVQRGMSDVITDVSQAHELAESILKDLMWAHPKNVAEIPFHPLVQLHDVVQMTNSRLGTSPETDIFKVVSITNTFSKDRKRTTLELQGHDLFISEPSVAPKPATSLRYEMQKRVIQNYPNSGWAGYEKETSFPMLKWNSPTQYVDGTTMPDDFGGYIIERGTQLSPKGLSVYADPRWAGIASVPSYLGALDRKINYFYDYTASAELHRWVKSGKVSGNTVTLYYRITAINSHGLKSTVSSEISIAIPLDIYRNKDGVPI